jgi:hypothetical protein
MFKSFRDKVAFSGMTVLSIGVALLIFTFVSAYGFLTQNLSMIASDNFAQTFGEALVPLIGTCVRLMYLGIMGWVASLMTLRGVTIVTHTPQSQPSPLQEQTETERNLQSNPQSQEPKSEKSKDRKGKEETPQREPEVVLIPPEAIPEPKVSNA